MNVHEKSKVEMLDLHNEDYVKSYLKKNISRITRLLPLIDVQRTDVIGDFGCGAGMLLWALADKIAEYHGIDFSEPFIREARRIANERGLHNAGFIAADIVRYCKSNNGKFDKAFTLDFSEHIYDKDFLEIYQAIYSSLKPAGVLYLHTPNGAYFLEAMRNKGILRQRPEHVAVRTAREYARLLEACGFKNISAQIIPHYVFPLRQLHVLSFLPGMKDILGARMFIKCGK
jgi:2-polyprenyl-3-methyl-5-hydroxy-6-metoxy-1,4-benzoquinol methylase